MIIQIFLGIIVNLIMPQKSGSVIGNAVNTGAVLNCIMCTCNLKQKKEAEMSMSSDIVPVNREAKYSFKFANLSEITLTHWPPESAYKFGWNNALSEMKRHWVYLSSQTIWSPYPTLSYCVGIAEAPLSTYSKEELASLSPQELAIKKIINNNEKIKVIYWLFPMVDPQYPDQTLAQVGCEAHVGVEPGNIKAWVNANAEEELDNDNIRELGIALDNIEHLNKPWWKFW